MTKPGPEKQFDQTLVVMVNSSMKELAENLDKVDARFPLTLTPDDMCNMAYQLQYFFEAMEYIADRVEFWKDAHFKDDRARWEAYRDSLNKALIHKE